MTCNFCATLRQYGLNFLEAGDHMLNAVLGGDPAETLSSRTGRAAMVGSKAAKLFCKVLNLINGNHCEWSMLPGSVGRELWHWVPQTEIMYTELVPVTSVTYNQDGVETMIQTQVTTAANVGAVAAQAAQQAIDTPGTSTVTITAATATESPSPSI